MTSERRSQWKFWLFWSSLLFIAAALLLLVRSRLDKAHVALVFLLVVLGGSAAGGRLLGMALAAAAFLIFDLGRNSARIPGFAEEPECVGCRFS